MAKFNIKRDIALLNELQMVDWSRITFCVIESERWANHIVLNVSKAITWSFMKYQSKIETSCDRPVIGKWNVYEDK